MILGDRSPFMLRMCVVVSLVVFTGCGYPPLPAAGDAAVRCQINSQCTDVNSPACDTAINGGTCVACTVNDPEACGGKTPICTNDRCTACTQHSDCKDSSACLLDGSLAGSCVAVAQVAYVDAAGTDNPSCTKNTPCTKVMKALATGRPYIKLHGTTDEGALITIDNQNVTLLADPGATLTQAPNGAILQITGTSTVEIDDLQISGAKGAGNPGISVPVSTTVKLLLQRVTISGSDGAGINCQSGSLTISRSTLSSNKGGGISTALLPITFDITNTFFHHNGDSGNSIVGGASLIPLPGSASRFEFNTIVDNQVKDSVAISGGVFCDQTGFAAPNNIIARNSVNNDATRSNANTLGACPYPTSTIAQTMVTAFRFRSPDNSPYDYHIQSSSSAIGKATTRSSITVDFDNQPRPTSASDQGADQYTP